MSPERKRDTDAAVQSVVDDVTARAVLALATNQPPAAAGSTIRFG